MAQTNTFYEDFERGASDLKIHQVDENGDEVPGTEGVIVSKGENGYMGYEGEHSLKVPLNHTYDYKDSALGSPVSHLRVDFSDAAGLEFSQEDHFGFAFGGKEQTSVQYLSGYNLSRLFSSGTQTMVFRNSRGGSCRHRVRPSTENCM